MLKLLAVLLTNLLFTVNLLAFASDNQAFNATKLVNTNPATNIADMLPRPAQTSIEQPMPNAAINPSMPIILAAPQPSPEKPQLTVLLCADSPLRNGMLENMPSGDLFIISNLGNQLATALGSVDYGVNALASSMLLIIGHQHCKAIQTASTQDPINLDLTIAKDLTTLPVVRGGANQDNVNMNVHSQVALALKRYATRVKNGELLVVGAVYEQQPDTPQAAGKLHIININGETDSNKLNNIAATAAQAE